jgi:hypothetical protein
MKLYTLEEWQAEGRRLFGADHEAWRFTCPLCGYVSSVADFKQYAAAGATQNSATCECIGRYTGAGDSKAKTGGPCNYAGYGLFRLSPIRITGNAPDHPTHCFAFAGAPTK